MLDARWLRTFAAVVEHQSFVAAASALGYTQSAVSQQIAELERATGLTLLQRRPVRPTAAGEIALKAARQTGTVLDAAATELRALRDGTAGTVRVGAFRTAAERLVAPALGTFAAQHPAVRVSVAQLETAAAYDALIAGDLDLAITFDDRLDHQSAPAPIVLRHLITDDVLVAVPRGHRLAGHDSILLDQLAGERWIDAPNAGVTPTLARLLPDRERGTAYDGDDFAVVLAMVAAGLGIALVAGLATPASPTVVTRRLAGVNIGRDVNLARLDTRALAPAVGALEQHLTDAGHRLADARH
jgi:DNA-binding transcriptional LysR family regulator